VPVEPFGARLYAAAQRCGPLCVGIDPHRSLLAQWGLGDNPAGLERFSRTVVAALADRVAALKPQSAFFERHGSRGIAVLEQVVADIRAAGGVTVMDAKRGDIGSTVQAYADAYLDPSSTLGSDAVTASPYLGFGSLQPLLDMARRHGNGVFVLAYTSNPEGASVQRAVTADGRTVAGSVLSQIRAENAGAAPWGSVGAVIAATIEVTDENLDIRGPVLAPGYGAQGGTAADLRRIFGPTLRHVLPATSREVLAAGPDVVRLQAAAARAAEQLQAVHPG
jgi:orotidine-5'-phosphate decarboxylase